ncbi:hypothetical protein U1Q18_050077 [Sarracenia purpurea var. burkii]
MLNCEGPYAGRRGKGKGEKLGTRRLCSRALSVYPRAMSRAGPLRHLSMPTKCTLSGKANLVDTHRIPLRVSQEGSLALHAVTSVPKNDVPSHSGADNRSVYTVECELPVEHPGGPRAAGAFNDTDRLCCCRKMQTLSSHFSLDNIIIVNALWKIIQGLGSGSPPGAFALSYSSILRGVCDADTQRRRHRSVMLVSASPLAQSPAKHRSTKIGSDGQSLSLSRSPRPGQ